MMTRAQQDELTELRVMRDMLANALEAEDTATIGQITARATTHILLATADLARADALSGRGA